MGRGGARNRGPGTPQQGSELWIRRRKDALVLPAEGYGGEVPNFPLPSPLVREIAVWRRAWRTPQAAAWAAEPWRWQAVAMWVRWTVRAEKRNATASIAAQVTRLADQIGMTPAGLRENGWKIEPPRVTDADVLAFPEGARPTGRQSAATRSERFRRVTPPTDGGEGA